MESDVSLEKTDGINYTVMVTRQKKVSKLKKGVTSIVMTVML